MPKKALPPWVSALIAAIEKFINDLLAQHSTAKTACSKRGCDPTCDPCCLSLEAAIHAAEVSRDSLKVHAALCCTDPPCEPAV